MIIDGVRIDLGAFVDKTISEDTPNIFVQVEGTGANVQQSSISNVYDTLDQTKKTAIAYLESDYWLLDGSFVMSNDDINLADKFTEDNWTWTGGRYYEFGDFLISNSEGYKLEVIYEQIKYINVYSGHKYYVGVLYNGDSPKLIGDYSVFHLRIQLIDKYRYIREPIPMGTISNVGMIFDAQSNDVGKFQIRAFTSSESSSYFGIFSQPKVIDLTEAFGAGNEPTLEECNKLFERGFYNSGKVGFESEFAQLSIDTAIRYIFNNPHDSYGIILHAPKTYNVDILTINYYNNLSLIGTSYATKDKNGVYKNHDTHLQWNRVDIVIPKQTIDGPFQRRRLYTVFFGSQESYEEDELLNVSANKVLNITADYVESGSVEFSFFNNGMFDIQSIKDLSQSVIDRLKMQVYFRKQFESEYKLFGTYYVESGDVSENGHIVSLTGHNGLYKLDDVMFTNGKVYSDGRKLSDWAYEVAKTAGVLIVVSSDFSYIISKGYIPSVPCREALRLIAECGHGMLGIDENDLIHLWAYKDIVKDKGVLSNENIVNDSLSLSNPNKYMGVKVTEYNFAKQEFPVEIAKIEKFELTGSLQRVEIDFNIYPVADDVEIISTFGDISDIVIQSDKVIFSIRGSANTTTNIVVMATPYDTVTSFVERGETQKNVKEISDNYLITAGLAEAVADYQLEHAVKKYDYEMETVISDEISIGDTYKVQDDSVVITEVEIDISYEDQNETLKGVDK